MNKVLLAGVTALVLVGTSVSAYATPEQDRKQILDLYKNKFPNIKFNDYVYGALNLNPDAKAQYDSIMSFPPFSNELDRGQALWEKPFKNGKTFSSCFPNGGKNVAGNYPMFDTATGKVLTFEGAINACLKANGETEFKYDDMKTMGLITAYAKSLSDGMKVNVKVEGPGALAAYEDGKKFYFTRRGQLNFSCANCHIDNPGNKIRTELLSPMVGHAAHWPEYRQGTELTTLQGRFKQCNSQVRAVPLESNSEAYNNLEYFLTYMSNGLPMETPVFRK